VRPAARSGDARLCRSDEREFGGDPDFEDAEGLVRELRACAESIERVGTLEGAPALIRYLNRIRAARPCELR